MKHLECYIKPKGKYPWCSPPIFRIKIGPIGEYKSVIDVCTYSQPLNSILFEIRHGHSVGKRCVLHPEIISLFININRWTGRICTQFCKFIGGVLWCPVVGKDRVRSIKEPVILISSHVVYPPVIKVSS